MRHGEGGVASLLPSHPPDELTSGGVDGLMSVWQLAIVGVYTYMSLWMCAFLFTQAAG